MILDPSGLPNNTNYKAIYDQSPDMYLSVDPENATIEECNQTVLNNTGYHKDEIVGRSVFFLYHPGCLAEAEKAFNTYVTEGTLKNAELTIRRKDGSTIPVLLNVNSVHDESGKVLYASSCLRDITEIKIAEEQLIASNKELESFSNSVVHDLQTPIKSVLGYVEMLIEGYGASMDKEVIRFLNSIKNNSAKMDTLLEELLSFSRVETKKVQLSYFDLNVLVKDVLSQIKKITPIKDKFELGTLHYVNADYNLLLHVVINLISNAIKFSSKEEYPLIRISSKETSEELIFSVEDNGVGFDMKHSKKLFHVFQRLHSVSEFEGSGVGLALSHKVITKHKGRIWAESKIGQGATFFFSLPK